MSNLTQLNCRSRWPVTFPVAGYCLALLVIASVGLVANSSWAAGDMEPEVEAMVEKGIKFLEQNYRDETFYPFDSYHYPGYGEHAIMAYTHMKVKHDPSNPVVQQGIKAAVTFARLLTRQLPPPPGQGHIGRSVYSAGICAMLLAEVDAIKYRPELDLIAKHFSDVQFHHGGYSYPNEPMGDVSQTQYALLALWKLDKVGVMIDYDSVLRTINWLLRVQDPSGGWPYQAIDPGRNSQRVKQERVTASMGVAGGSALLIGGAILQLWGYDATADQSKIYGMPKAVTLFREGMDNFSVKRPTTEKEVLLKSVQECDRWLVSNSPNPDKLASRFPMYQLYTTERYYSFREMALEQEPDHNPPWFREGVQYVKAKQMDDGGWPAEAATARASASSLAILFLIRSTQKTIEEAATQALAGGRTLPKDTTQITVKGTKIEGKPVAQEMGNLLSMLEQDGANKIEGKSIPENLQLADDPRERAAQLDRMERLVRGSQSWQARRVAVRLLGQSDELRVVPTLIFALSDPDSMVPRYARDGLRFISRKFEGFGLGDSPNAGEIDSVQKRWRAWYRTMDPGYVFLDYDL